MADSSLIVAGPSDVAAANDREVETKMARTFWKTLFCTFAALLLPLAQALAVPLAPDALVKATSEEVLATIKQTSDRGKLLQLVQARVVMHFDFRHMTQLAVGKSWPKATAAQQQSLEKQFRDILVRTYTNALQAGANSKATIRYLAAPIGGNDVLVKTQVVESGKPAIAINYNMENKPDGWKVYDVTVDGISLVTNYRSSFATTIGSSGIDGLIKSLADKNSQNAGRAK